MKRQPYIPLGCDQQGRYPQAAEASTDLGADDSGPTDRQIVKAVLADLLISCALVGAIAIVFWVAVRA